MMMMMGAHFMSMMQGVNPFGKGNPASPEDLQIYLTPKGKGMAAPRVPSKSPPDESQDTQESQPHEVNPAGVKPLKLFYTGGDETDDQPAPETSSQKPLDAIQQAGVVEDAIDRRSQGCQDEEASRSSARIQAEEN